jgi:hypothetical protein
MKLAPRPVPADDAVTSPPWRTEVTGQPKPDTCQTMIIGLAPTTKSIRNKGSWRSPLNNVDVPVSTIRT